MQLDTINAVAAKFQSYLIVDLRFKPLIFGLGFQCKEVSILFDCGFEV